MSGTMLPLLELNVGYIYLKVWLNLCQVIL